MKLLYLEDNPQDADLVRRCFARLMPEAGVDIADCLAAARERLAGGEVYEVVLADLRLSDGSGLDLLAEIRERSLPMAVVMLTGSGDQDAVIAALKAGADDYLLKSGDYLDRLPKVAVAALARFRSSSQKTTGLMRVLYAEHNPFDVDLVRRHLGQRAPYIRLECVDSAERVLDLLPKSRDEVSAYDVVLLDYRLPGVDALDVIKVLRHERHLEIPVVLVTGHGSEEVAAMALHLGVDDYLTKHQGYLHELPATLENAYRKAELIRERNQLLESDARIRLLLDSTAEAIYGMDTEGNCTFVNPACLRALGYDDASEMLGKHIHGLIHHSYPDGSDYPGTDCPIYQAFQRNEPMHGDDQVFWRKDGTSFPAEYWSYPMVRDGEVVGAVNTFFDISRLRRSEQQLEHLAHYDPLTDLPNRLLAQSRLEHALDRAQRHDYRVGVLYLDLDHFKAINDSLGHPVGDELLVAVSQRLKRRLREEDTLGRMGGDEFLIVLEPVEDPQEAAVVARDLLAELAQPYKLQSGRELFIQGSIGISLFPLDGSRVTELLRNADAALFSAKDNGRNRFSFYAPEMNAEALANLGLEAALKRALKQGELCLHYQPKVDIRSGRVCGAEALIRWRREGVGLVPPGQFIPVAERSDLIVAIGGWVIDEACRQIRAWLDAGQQDVRVAVNLSARQFHVGGLDQVIAEALARHGVAASHLELEVTESMLMQRPEEAVLALGRLKAMGLKLSLDDFGTGYSSLAYLMRFPIDVIKIDQSFVRDIVSDANSAIIAISIITLAHRMGLKVVAEGVETEGQLGYLGMQGCDEMQGYFFSRPVPAAAFAELIGSGRTLAAVVERTEKGTLLLVDDEPGILSALRRELRGEGYRILTAGSAPEAMELLARNAVQVIMSDQRMPEMSGTDFLSQVKEMYPDTVRIVLSGYADLDTIIRAVNEGSIYKFLIKPWDGERLREHLRDAFRYHEAVILPRKP